MTERKISQQVLADNIGKSKTTVNNYLTGKNAIEIPVLQDIASYLGVPISYFFDDEQIKTKTGQIKNRLNTASVRSTKILNSEVYEARIRDLEALIAEKDERIKELKEMIDYLKNK